MDCSWSLFDYCTEDYTLEDIHDFDSFDAEYGLTNESEECVQNSDTETIYKDVSTQSNQLDQLLPGKYFTTKLTTNDGEILNNDLDKEEVSLQNVTYASTDNKIQTDSPSHLQCHSTTQTDFDLEKLLCYVKSLPSDNIPDGPRTPLLDELSLENFHLIWG